MTLQRKNPEEQVTQRNSEYSEREIFPKFGIFRVQDSWIKTLKSIKAENIHQL